MLHRRESEPAREIPEGGVKGWNRMGSWKEWNSVQKSSVRYMYAATVHGCTRVFREEFGYIGQGVRVSECVKRCYDDTQKSRLGPRT